MKKKKEINPKPHKSYIKNEDQLDSGLISSKDYHDRPHRNGEIAKQYEAKIHELDLRPHKKIIPQNDTAFDTTPLDPTKEKRLLKSLNGEPSEWLKKNNLKGTLRLYDENYTGQKKYIHEARKDNFKEILDSNAQNLQPPKQKNHKTLNYDMRNDYVRDLVEKSETPLGPHHVEPCLAPQQMNKEDLINCAKNNIPLVREYGIKKMDPDY
jgi:hypothetical protein